MLALNSLEFMTTISNEPNTNVNRKETMTQPNTTAKQTHVSHNSGNNEWYTPANILESARTVLGGFDIDVASNEVAQNLVKAEVFYTKEDSSLDKDWMGSIWMNPPYSAALIKQFCLKLNTEVKKGNTTSFITLTNNATETMWFKDLYEVSSCFCLLHKRVKFLDENLKPVNAPLQGQVVCYLGDNKEGFIREFSKLGNVMIKP